jgi:ACR3 family arsenite efflux pump ArsB
MRDALEQGQVFIYLGAASLGLLAGTVAPGPMGVLEPGIWPVLALLLYVIFTQVRLTELPGALRDGRFLAAAILGNFVVLPGVVWLLLGLVPAHPGIYLGVLLVLLVPCTDWFVAFSRMGGGDASRAIAFTPVSLLLQLILLPFYLWLLLPGEIAVALPRGEMLTAFGLLIVLPLLAAAVTRMWVSAAPGRRKGVLSLAGRLPVPLLALVVFMVAASQVELVLGFVPVLLQVLAVFVAFLVIAVVLARVLATLFALPPAQGRVLAFSFGTRNSFVVLPLALALPVSLEIAAVVIVLQSLVELLGMIVLLRLVPRYIFPPAANVRS